MVVIARRVTESQLATENDLLPVSSKMAAVAKPVTNRKKHLYSQLYSGLIILCVTIAVQDKTLFTENSSQLLYFLDKWGLRESKIRLSRSSRYRISGREQRPDFGKVLWDQSPEL